MNDALNEAHLDDSASDVWSTIWKNGIYSSSLYYHHCFRNEKASKIYR
jgi:hypothetical protein